MPPKALTARARTFPLVEPFVIARGAILEVATIEIEISAASGVIGRGAAVGIDYAGETPVTMLADVARARAAVEVGTDREALLNLLPPGGARFAIDAALWDLEAKLGRPDPFAACGVAPNAVVSAYTIGIRSLAAYEAAARNHAANALLKIKVDAREPLAAVEAVRRGAPAAELIVDPNQAWSVADLMALAPRMAKLGVALLEQPIAVGDEGGLDGYRCPVPLCADELLGSEADLPKVAGRFQYANIKLDKAGGLTAALKLADACEARELGLMVGCMLGPSRAMAPAMVLAQRCRFADVDGPRYLAEDHSPGFAFNDGRVDRPHLPALWG